MIKYKNNNVVIELNYQKEVLRNNFHMILTKNLGNLNG